VQGGRARGVRLKGGKTYLADTVISTADIKKTYNSLIPEAARKPSHTERVNKYRMAAPFFNAYLGADIDLSSKYPNRDHFSMPTWSSYRDIEKLLTYREGDSAESWLERVRPQLPAYVHCSDVKDPGNTRYSPEGVIIETRPSVISVQ
jgi:phytoene dehydrogenase-like protein